MNFAVDLGLALLDAGNLLCFLQKNKNMFSLLWER